MIPKLGCIIRPEIKAQHALMPVGTRQLLPAWSRIENVPRILGHNDQIGDCACVAAVNAVQTELGVLGHFEALPDTLAVQVYSAVTGYVPGDESTDNGTDPEQLFAWWQNNPIGPYKLKSFMRLNPLNLFGLRNSIVGRMGVYLCVDLAVEQQNQTEWTPAGTPGSWGGHAVWGDMYEADWLEVTTWGTGKRVSDDFLTSSFTAMAYGLDLVPV